MLLTLKNQIEVPTEIILLILDHLSRADLKTSSLVCLEFARITRLLLFRSITISAQQSDIDRFLNIIRRPQLCCVVQCLIWQDVFPSPEMPGSEDHAQQPYFDEQEADLINRICSVSANKGFAVKGVQVCLDALIEGFEAMSRLKTLIPRDMREIGNFMDAVLNPLTSLNGQYPLLLSDAALRLMHFHEGGDSVGFVFNNGGFCCLLAALIITGASVESLITERPQSLLKQGIPAVPPFLSVYLEMRSVNEFKNLRRINLCLDSPRSGLGPAFPSCLEAADQLEHLEISVTYMPRTDSRLTVLQNKTSFMKLHTLVLESATFTKEAIIEFLIRRARSLIRVALWNCQLVKRETWKAVVQALAEAEHVEYKSFILNTARVESEAILRFINKRGIDIPPIEEDSDSDYGNLSGGLTSICDPKVIVEKHPDGPEFNSDQDSDIAPDPGVDSDEDSDEDQVATRVSGGEDSAAARFYDDMWDGLGFA